MQNNDFDILQISVHLHVSAKLKIAKILKMHKTLQNELGVRIFYIKL